MKKMIARLLVVVVLLAAGAVLFAAGERQKLGVDEQILLDIEGLRSLQAQSDNLLIVDYGRSYNDFLAGHIPGAVFLDISLFWSEVDGIEGMLLPLEDISDELGLRGVSRDLDIVVYDAGNSLWASRAFWAFEYLGQNRVQVLDGGLAAWRASGAELSTEAVARPAVEYQVFLRPELLAGFDEVLDCAVGTPQSENSLILDARSSGEFDGSDKRAARGGHIPRSLNLDWRAHLAGDGRFLPRAGLEDLYDFLERDQRVIALCQTGVRGAHSYFVLRYLGFTDVAVYDGSWAEWGNREDVPIAR